MAEKLTKAQDRKISTDADAARLFALSAVSTAGCWEWIGSRNAKQYGQFAYRGRTWKAHRASFTIFCSEIPEGFLVCHRCDNPPCVNPDHLFLGTAGMNMRDMVLKGRNSSLISSQQDHFKAGHAPRGEFGSGAKITDQVAGIILRKAAAGSLTKDLASEFGLSRFSIQALLRGETWKHIERPPGLPRKSGAYSRAAGRLALENTDDR